MSGGVGEGRVQASPRAERVRQEMWLEALDLARARLARIDRGESWAPEQMVRVLRAFVAPERKPAARAGGAE